LRLQIDERYTASLLIGLSQSDAGVDEPKSSSMLCSDSYSTSNDWFKDETQIPFQRRARSPGKYTQSERETFRRERNRMHAKRTRDRKKLFFEISEKVITNMEKENKILRNYLVAINVMKPEYATMCEENDRKARLSLASLKSGMEGLEDRLNTGFIGSTREVAISDDDDEDDDYDGVGADVDKDSNHDSYDGIESNGSSHGETSHESTSSCSLTHTPSVIDDTDMYGKDDVSVDGSDEVTDASMSFQVQDKTSLNFVNKLSLDALNAHMGRNVHR